MDLNLKGKNALVCGSTQGIGKASALELSALGANITLLARNEESLKATLKDLDLSLGQKHDYIVADFSDADGVKKAIHDYLLRMDKPIHILVNNTGGPKGGLIQEAGVDEFIAAFSMHIVCNQQLVQAVLPAMKREGFGRIINIISTSVKAPIKGLGVSNTIRAAVGNWAKTLAGEVAAYGITVNNVLPGYTNTSRLDFLINSTAEKTGKTVSEVKKDMEGVIPMGRIGKPEEIANVVGFIASPAASFLTGTSIAVDGGSTPCM